MSESETETQAKPSVTIGETLKDLREQRNLTIEEIATRLHLDPRIIRLLETDAFDELPASIFVRGYIRNYAKELDVDAGYLIDIYDETGVEEEPEIIPEVKQPRQTSSSDKPVKAFTYLISLILVILVIAWWQSNYLIPDSGSDAISDTEEDRGQPPAFDYPYDIVEHPDLKYYEKPPEPAAGTEDRAAGETGAKAGETVDTDTAAAEPEETGDGEIIRSETDGPDRVVMRLTADSWIEVFDTGGRKVYVGLARAGDTLILRGEAPFSVLLGFAQGVEIEFNGEQFDPASYSRSGVARFTLGE